MKTNATHAEYDANLPAWLRARDVIAGEDAVKAGAVQYLPRLDAQSDQEYADYKARASFFNATGRTSTLPGGKVEIVIRMSRIFCHACILTTRFARRTDRRKPRKAPTGREIPSTGNDGQFEARKTA